MKRFLSLILTLCLAVTICSGNALAAQESFAKDGLLEYATPEDAIEPRYVVSCPLGGKHQMEPKAGGNAYSGTPSNPGTFLRFVYINQCTMCGEVLVSEYMPYRTHKLGYYKVLGVWPDPIPYYGTDVYLNGASFDYFGGLVTQDSYWQGYSFLPN